MIGLNLVVYAKTKAEVLEPSGITDAQRDFLLMLVKKYIQD